MFKVGDEVICVNTNFKNLPNRKYPRKNKIYTIRGIYKSVSEPGQLGLLLNEIINSPNNVLMREIGFLASRFRKLEINPESKEWSENLIKELEEELNKIEEEICIDNQHQSYYDISTKNKSILPIRKNDLCSITSTH